MYKDSVPTSNISTIGIVTGLWARRSRNLDFIPGGWDESIFSSPKRNKDRRGGGVIQLPNQWVRGRFLQG